MDLNLGFVQKIKLKTGAFLIELGINVLGEKNQKLINAIMHQIQARNESEQDKQLDTCQESKPKLSKLLAVLRASGESSLCEFADEIALKEQQNRKEQQEELENSRKFELSASIYTDDDFLICGNTREDRSFYGESREEVIELFRDYYLNRVDYGYHNGSERIAYFKKEYIEATAEKLKHTDFNDFMGNWECSFSIEEPSSDDSNADTGDDSRISILGVRFY